MGGTVNNVVSIGGTDISSGVAYLPESGIIRVKLTFALGAASPVYAGYVMHQDFTAAKIGNDTTQIINFANKNNPWFNWWRRAATSGATSDHANLGIICETPESQTQDDLDDFQVVKVCVHGVVQANCDATVAKGDLLTATPSTPSFSPAAAVVLTPVLIAGVALEDAVAADPVTGARNTWIHLEGLYGIGANIFSI